MTGCDYIVVGAGTAGCVLAARLTQDASTRVLLLEAGSAARTLAMTVPGAWPELLGTAADWAGTTTAQADAGPVAYPRGRTLGGSGAINAMAHVRGHRAVYDAWAAAGAPGWGYADLLPYFRRSEHADGRDPALRGASGPVRVAPVPVPDRHAVARAFAGALARLGCPVTEDLSGQQQEGVAWADLAIAGGQRISPAEAYLRPVLDRPNPPARHGAGHRRESRQPDQRPALTQITHRHTRYSPTTPAGFFRKGEQAWPWPDPQRGTSSYAGTSRTAILT